MTKKVKLLILFCLLFLYLIGSLIFFIEKRETDLLNKPNNIKVFTLGEPVVSGGIATTIDKVSYENKLPNESKTLKPALTYAIIDVKIQNQGNKPKFIKIGNYRLLMGNWTADLNPGYYKYLKSQNPSFDDRKLNPKEQISGKIAFIIPIERSTLKNYRVQIPALIYEQGQLKYQKEIAVK
ncbi:DUF4352 domain-containing protein [Neobacillus sp. PS2-9]|uniref:DUF4352 domain-containing protein n=1 Tax=Neobacillus sp. PS2-9 TaxID=3070676 RepID=UPI0027E065E5|nr:DUF4352 domain-containing protein [Neobacillus sp. PS2-9]WML58721.1 DUF4352 domain-containing protein [Neobacillus sp. PS2-9]